MSGKKIRLGMIGCGNIKHQHMAGIYEQVPELNVTAACDVNPVTLNDFSDRYGIPERYASIDEMLENADLDAVSISIIPEPAKCEMAIKCLERGLHVLVEKPMALTVKEAEAMGAAARKAGLVLQAGYNRRFEPIITQARDIINDVERFGQFTSMRVIHAGMCEVPYVFCMAQLPHTLDLIEFLGGKVATLRTVTRKVFNQERFDEIQASLDRPGEREYNAIEPGLVGLSAETTLEFANGAIGVFSLLLDSSPGRGHDYEVFGDKGACVTLNDLKSGVFENRQGSKPINTGGGAFRKPSSFGLEYRHFYEWIISGESKEISLQDALDATCLYEGFIRSLQTDEKINIINGKEV